MATETRTLEQLQGAHDRTVDSNRALGVIDYKSGEKQSEQVYEVTAGRKYVPDGRGGQKVLGPGHLFHPTERQVERGVLRGKAREVTGSVYRDIEARRGRSENRSTGADIGIRALPMAGGTAKAAIAAGLTEEDFQGVEPSGPDGQYTRKQVEEMIAAREAN